MLPILFLLPYLLHPSSLYPHDNVYKGICDGLTVQSSPVGEMFSWQLGWWVSLGREGFLGPLNELQDRARALAFYSRLWCFPGLSILPHAYTLSKREACLIHLFLSPFFFSPFLLPLFPPLFLSPALPPSSWFVSLFLLEVTLIPEGAAERLKGWKMPLTAW